MREEMENRNLNNRQMGDMCGVAESTIWRIVKGQLCPNDELKWKIAGVLGIRMDRMWEWPPLVPPHPNPPKPKPEPAVA